MKCIPALSAIVALTLAACDSMTGPITSGDFDPLRPPGGNVGPGVRTTQTFKAGQFVRAAMDNAAFFKVRPNGDADADKLLVRGTSVKVISYSGSYVKVELDSGEIGFIPAVMLEDPNAVVQTLPINPGEYQVYPPLPGGGIGGPLPIIDPAGLPPEGAIPTVIDPDAPANNTPVPPVTPTTETFPTPVEPKVEFTPPPPSTPPPPNSEEPKAEKPE